MQVTTFFVLVGFLIPIAAGATSPSRRFWDPFRGVHEQVDTTLSDAITSVLRQVEEIIGRSARSLAIPDPTRIGFRPLSAYRPGLLRLSVFPNAPSPSPPQSRLDATGTGTPCGGDAGDPYWANDCSCRCSRGGVAALRYEVSDRCPEDDNRTCEDCRPITRHDKFVTTVADCRDQFGGDAGGGNPANPVPGL